MTVKWKSANIPPSSFISVILTDASATSWNEGYSMTLSDTSGVPIDINLNDGEETFKIPSYVPAGQYKIWIWYNPEGYSNTGYLDQSDRPFTIISSTINKSPVVTGVGGPTQLKVGEAGTWSIKAYDPDGTQLSYAVNWGDVQPMATALLKEGSSSTSQEAGFDHTYTSAGTYKIVFTVTDDKGAGTQASLTVLVGSATSNNHWPQIGPMAVPAEIQVNEPTVFNFNASDQDNDNLSWGVSWGDGTGEQGACVSPASASTSQSGSGTTYQTKHTWSGAGTYLVRATVSDCRGGTAETSFEVRVGLASTNSSPKIIGFPAIQPGLKVGDKVYLSWEAVDADGDALTWAVSWGDKSDSTSGSCADDRCTKYATTHSWDQSGVYEVNVKVSDGKGGADRAEFKVSVGDEPEPILGGIVVSEPGHYIFKMNWFNSAAKTWLWLDSAAMTLSKPAEAGATALDVAPSRWYNQGQAKKYSYFIVDPSTKNSEELAVADWSGSSSDKAKVSATLSQPLRNSYSTQARVVPLLGTYYGYYPPLAEAIDLGEYQSGEEIVIAHLSQWWGKFFGPVTSNDPDYYLVEQGIDSSEAIYRLTFDDALHYNWIARGVRAGYNDGSFDVYHSGGGVTNTNPLVVVATTPAAPVMTDKIALTDKEKKVENEANKIFTGQVQDVAPEVKLERAKELVAKAENIMRKIKALQVELDELTPAIAAVRDFIALGTDTTEKLGIGERAGVVESFRSAFGKVPQSEAQWSDVIKIANGRFPSVTNPVKEKSVETAFKKIYLRAPDRSNPNDNAAVVVMAYGLRSANRNLNSEQAASQSFKAIFGKSPTTASDWDAVRAIAYSGATRK